MNRDPHPFAQGGSGWSGDVRVPANQALFARQEWKVIVEYVTEGMDLTGPSSLDIPLFLHKLITDGIGHLRRLSRR
jgi:hypothetical protein